MIIKYEHELPIRLPAVIHNVHIECSDDLRHESCYANTGDILVNDCEYLFTPGNLHHYTNTFLFNVFLPILLQACSLSLNKDEYKLYSYSNVYDFHIPTNDYHVKCFSDTDGIIEGTSFNCLRDIKRKYINNCPGNINEYHTLYSFTHRCTAIINYDNHTNRILLLNCDSMIAPIIPLITRYFKMVIVMDNRSSNTRSFLYKEIQTHITDYICCLYTPYLRSNKEKYNLR